MPPLWVPSVNVNVYVVGFQVTVKLVNVAVLDAYPFSVSTVPKFRVLPHVADELTVS